MEWNKYPDVLPQEYKEYLTCDQFGHITIKKYGEIWIDKNGEYISDEKKAIGFQARCSHKLSNNVYFWMEIPMPPTINNELLIKMESLKREKEKLLSEIRAVEAQLKGNQLDTHIDNKGE